MSPASIASPIESLIYVNSSFQKKKKNPRFLSHDFQSWLKRKKKNANLIARQSYQSSTIYGQSLASKRCTYIGNRVIDSTTYYRLSRLVSSRTSGQRSREPVVVAAIHTLGSSARLSSIHTYESVPLSFIYLACARKLWNHARVSFTNKQTTLISDRSGAGPADPIVIPHFFSNVRLSSALFSRDITGTE